ncbi:MAG: hypothetical protein PWP31_1754, partial [Clostridia bacterium]|nr:hypothetical protein [Clostridia bacterium]
MNVTKIYQYPKKKTITKGEPYVIFGQKVTKFIEELLILIEEKTGLKLSFVMMNLRFGGIIIKNEKEDKEER